MSLKSDLAKLRDKGKITQRQYVRLINQYDKERPQGRWIIKYIFVDELGMMVFHCSECDREFIETSRFCPHCGVRMEGSDDD